MAGEGLVSLARSFLHAGGANVLASLWKVDDEATAAMMEMFYARLLAVPAMSPAAALAAAQQEMHRRERWRDPYYWSGWVLVSAR
jgi:CHAT domain-containing protein